MTHRQHNKDIPYHLVAIFILLITGIGVAGYFYYLHQKKYIIGEKQNELFAVADLKVKQIIKWREERSGDAALIMENRTIARRIKEFLENSGIPGSRQEIMHLFKTLEEAYRYTGIYLFDAKGRLRLTSNYEERVDEHIKTYVLNTLQTGKVTFSDLHRSESTKAFHIDILTPVFYDERQGGQAIGVVMLQSDPREFLFPLIQEWPTPSRTAETLLVARDGDEVVFLNELRHKKKTALSLRLPVSRNTLPAAMAVLGIEGIVEGNDYRDVPVFAAIRAIPGSHWFLVAKVDREEAEARIQYRAVMLALIVISSVLIAGLGVVLWWREQREKALQKSEARYRGALDNMMEGCQIIGPDWCYYYINEAAAKHGRRAKDEFLGHTMMEIYPEIEHTSMFETLRSSMNDRIAHNLENEFVYPDGARAWFELSVHPVPEGIFILSIDITERKLAEEELTKHRDHLEELVAQRTVELKALNRELEAFSYSVSHDLKTPLRAIDGFSNVMLEEYAGKLDDEGRRILNIIRDSAGQMSQLIHDLLDFSRINRQQITETDVDMDTLTDNVLKELGPFLSGRKIKLKISPLPSARGDRAMMRQVLLNLLSNAAKFTLPREETFIEVGSTVKDGETFYYVKDNGVGFDMRYADKLFGVFQRLHSSEEFEGTGIGLAIVQRVIHRHGGRVWAESKVNEGAAFYFSVPGNNSRFIDNELDHHKQGMHNKPVERG